MKTTYKLIFLLAVTGTMLISCNPGVSKKTAKVQDTILLSDTIQYHPVRIDRTTHAILPWFSSNPGESYDTVLMLVWNFWNNMPVDSNGLKYYMNHQVWKPGHDMRGLGGDQINMALSSWTLLYDYTGNPAVLENMKYLADTYLARSLSDSTDAWPYLPYPYNTDIHSGRYDGDMRNGKGILQPDKAGNFGYELIVLYKITGEEKYLKAAERIGNTLAAHVKTGNNDESPLPFRVNAKTGDVGLFLPNNQKEREEKRISPALYTSNWTGTMDLFRQLETFEPGKKETFQKAFSTILDWMKEYPLKTNKWGPFFEDIPGWSDTQTNAITFAMFILHNRDLFPDWKNDVKSIFTWTHQNLGNHEYEKYGVEVMNEQTVYRVPGNSHSSRQASIELLYTRLSGDTTYLTNAIRTLNWATYTVADDGRNRYIRDDIWLTDGYGDYVRHYLRAMAAWPELAPDNKDRLLCTTSVLKSINYSSDSIDYTTFDNDSHEELRLMKRPEGITMEGGVIKETDQAPQDGSGWTWKPLDTGGVLQVWHKGGHTITIKI